jgi:hypothetical protein
VKNLGPGRNRIRCGFCVLFFFSAFLAFTSHAAGSSGSLTVNPSNINFGSVPVGTTQTQSLTLTNPGGPKVTITQATLSGTGFTLSGLSYPLTLAGGQSVTCTVTFAPQATGNDGGSVAITYSTQASSGKKNNSSGYSSSAIFTVPVSGTAVTSGQLVPNPSSLNFGNVQVSSSQTQSGTLTNSGGSAVTISQASTSGAGFQISGLNLPLSLGAGQSAQFNITFAPQSSGSANGAIAFTSSASNPTLNVPLSGTGVTPGSLTPAPSSIGFGNVAIGSSQTTSETLTNSGGSSVSISQATATGSGFSLSGLTLPVTLSPGQSKSFTVAFAPQSSGLASGSITIASNGSNPSLSVSLSGSGVSAGTMAASPASLGFGSVQVGSSNSLSETLTNSGSSSVTISQATVTGSAFAVSGLSLPLTLNAGQSTTFSVSFAPVSSGTLTGNLAIVSNASNPTLNIGLSGTAVAPGALSANPSSVGFGSVQTGSNKTLSASVTNSGSSSVTISQVTASGAGYSVSGITPPVTLSAGQSYTFSVTFAPTVSGSASGAVSVGSNATNPTLSIPLTGTGTTPGSLAVTPSAINFGNVVVGTSQSQSATLSASTASVTVSSAGVSGSEFSVSGFSFPFTLAAGNTVSFTVTFTPQASGTASANITFASNATNPPTVESVSGSGTPPPQHSVALSWNASTSTVAGYNVYRGSISGGPYTKVNTALDGVTSYIDNSVQGGQTYYYAVTAVDGSGSESAYSNQVQAAIPLP